MSAPLYMDAVLKPRRSMTRRGMWWVLGVMLALNSLIASVFISLHAPFVPIASLIVMLLVWLALNASFRSAEKGERVRVSAEYVEVTQEGPGPPATLWSSPTAFTRVEIDDMGEEEWRVRLMLSGKILTLARALSPEERRAFGRQLQDAVKAARNERYPV